METFQTGNSTQPRLTDEAGRAQAMSVVQGFVQMWTRFESAIHKEIARMQGAEPGGPRKGGPYVDYGIFYRVSSGLYHRKEMTMGELSTSLSVPFSTATRIVDTLVTDGLVKRTQDPTDRRIVRVTLTAQGEKLHHTVERFTGEQVQSILSCLSREEQLSLLTMIQKVNKAMEKAT